jgi:TolB-like protein
MTLPPVDSLLVFPHFTKVVMVLDVVESVRLMEYDEHGFIQRWHRFVQHARGEVLPRRGGRMHKSLGDGLMLEFDDAQQSVQAAFDLQAWCAQLNETLPAEARMFLRVGSHLAEFVADEHDIYGTDVNLTARIATLAGPGEIVVSAALRDRLAAGLDAEIEDLGDCHLKHVKEPLRAYRVGPVGHAPVIEHGPGLRFALRPTLAVIPFSVRSGRSDQAMLGEALAEEVIASLSRTSELHVISRLSTTVFRDRGDSAQDIRRLLGASYILSGSCRTDGKQLLLLVELTESATGHVIWAERFQGVVNGIFAADDSLIAELVSCVSSAVMAQELDRVRSHALPTLEGYTLLLGAVGLMHRTSLWDFDRARQAFDALVDRARRHPLPHAWLGMWHVLRVQQGWTDDPQKEAQLALDSTQRAIDLDPQCALAWTVDGFVRTNLQCDLDAGLQSYTAALQINPNESLGWLLKGTLHAFKDEGPQAVNCTERALQLSPLDPLRYFYDSLSATAAASAGQYDRAIQLARRSLKANRMHTSTYRALAIAQAMSNREDEARVTVAELLKLEPGFNLRQFRLRSPTSRFPHGERLVAALRAAGVPE